MGEESALPILELRPEDLQDNILSTVGDDLTALLEEELVVESATESNLTASAAVTDQTKPADVEGIPADIAPTNSEA